MWLRLNNVRVLSHRFGSVKLSRGAEQKNKANEKKRTEHVKSTGLICFQIVCVVKANRPTPVFLTVVLGLKQDLKRYKIYYSIKLRLNPSADCKLIRK